MTAEAGRLGQLRLNRRGEALRIRLGHGKEGRREASVAADEILMEVPLRRVDPTELVTGPFVEGMGGVARDCILVREREGNAIDAFAELFDFASAPGLLIAKVVRGHADDGKALALVLRMQRLERLILLRKPAQKDAVLTTSSTLPLKSDSGIGLAIDRREGEIPSGRRRRILRRASETIRNESPTTAASTAILECIPKLRFEFDGLGTGNACAEGTELSLSCTKGPVLRSEAHGVASAGFLGLHVAVARRGHGDEARPAAPPAAFVT